jgi:hypothetical protein
MLNFRHECKMCTFGTGYPAVSREGENSTNALKNCAKTAAKINVRQVSELDEFQHIRSGCLEFYTNRAQPPAEVLPPRRTIPGPLGSITHPSSLLRAHAPDHDPPTSLGCPSVSGPVQVVASPCWALALPGVISALLSPDAWTHTPAVPLVHTPVSSQGTSAFTALEPARHATGSVQRLPYGDDIGAAVIR